MSRCQYGLITSDNEGFPNVVLEMMASRMKKIVMTPCAGDIDELTGVTVTKSFSSSELAESLISAIAANEDFSSEYYRVARGRSVTSFLDKILKTKPFPIAIL
jgi:hypothetical protein